MSELLEVSVDWLALREAEDARARSAALADIVPGLLDPGPSRCTTSAAARVR